MNGADEIGMHAYPCPVINRYKKGMDKKDRITLVVNFSSSPQLSCNPRLVKGGRIPDYTGGQIVFFLIIRELWSRIGSWAYIIFETDIVVGLRT